jgi:Flp pilus assembly protein TadB
VTLLAAAVASGLLIAPAAQHRILFRQHDKERLLHRSSHSALAGLVFLAIAITAAVLLVVDVLFSTTQAWITAAIVGTFLGWWWFAVPFWKRATNKQDQPDDADED